MSAFTVVLLFIASQAPPAPAGPTSLSLDDVLRIAEARSEAVASARAGVRRAGAEGQRALSELLPQASASLSYDRTLASEYDDLDFASAPGGGGGANPFAALPFGRDNTWRAGLSLSQNVYAGGRSLARRRLAEAGARSADVALESARAQALLDATQAYYDVVLAERLVQIAEESVGQAQRTVEQTELGVKNGTMPDFDLLRARVAYENQKPTLLQRRTELATARLRLLQQLELPLDRELVLTSTLEGELQDVTPAVAAVAPLGRAGGADDVVRAPVRQAQEARAAREAAVDVAWSQHLPSLDVSMTYGFVAYPEQVAPALDDVRDNWVVGVALRIPLFAGFRVNGDVESARADVDDADVRLHQATELAAFERRSAENLLATARSSYEATAGVVEQAQRALSIAELRFAEGVSTQLEVRDAQLLVDQAEVNRARAARDLQVARARIALLPSLPSGAVTPAALAGATASAGASAASTGAGGAAPSSAAAGGSPPAAP